MKILILIGMLIGCSNKVMKLKDKPLTSEQQAKLNNELIEASKSGDVTAITTLIVAGADVNQTDKNLETALMCAAQNGHVEAIRALIEGGGDVNHASEEGETALMFAVSKGHVEAIRELIKSGANVNYVQEGGLLNGGTALMEASEKGHLEAIRALIQSGANVNNAGSNGWTALMYAARYGHVEAIRALIAAGANVNKARRDGETALIYAAANGRVEAIKALLEDGADINHAGQDGWTPLMMAGGSGSVESIKALIAGGANVNNRSYENGETALMFATQNGHLLPFMKAYAKIAFNFADDVPEAVVINSAFILLLKLLDTDVCINRVTNTCEITQTHINEFLSDPLIDLSSILTHTTNDITLQMNSIQIIYKHLLCDVFDAIYNSNKKENMLDVIKRWDIPTKSKMVKHIFKDSNSDKLNTIFTNTTEQDPKANETRSALKEMVRQLLIEYTYDSQLKVRKEQIYKIFQDELDETIIIGLLYSRGWR